MFLILVFFFGLSEISFNECTHATIIMDECNEDHIPTCLCRQQGKSFHSSYIGSPSPHGSAATFVDIDKVYFPLLRVTRMDGTWKFHLSSIAHQF